MDKLDELLTIARTMENLAHDNANELEARVDYIFNNAEKLGRWLTNRELKATMDANPIIRELRDIEDKVEQLIKHICKSGLMGRLGSLLELQKQELENKGAENET